jgi:tetratricopeptide (TPR) repeat protein
MSHVVLVGGSAEQRARAARVRVPSTHNALVIDSRTLPFLRVNDFPLPAAPRAVVIDDVQLAFPDRQSGGTRLVLTQSTYLLQKWLDRLDADDWIIATADRAALERCAPEAFQGRGQWQHFEIVDIEMGGGVGLGAGGSRVGPGAQHSASPYFETFASFVSLATELEMTLASQLASAFAASDPTERLRLCLDAVALDPGCEVANLALASACRENGDGAGAREALDRAAELAPEWEAVFYESGKLSLVYDDLPRARDGFQRAADLMPSFSAAFSNLGATLGELGEPERALAAFRQALAHDPRGLTILNNIGVVCRELGRLDESEVAFRRVIAIDPAFVFGHYNLGHTLFLAGRYREALVAYEEGQQRDPQRNRRQGCRLAVVRFATGDATGAERDLWRSVDAAPPDEREDLLLEAYEIAHALVTQHPALGAQQPFLERIGAELAKSE